MNSFKLYLVILAVLVCPISCKTPVQEHPAGIATSMKESFIETNKYLRERHHDHMMAFQHRAGWEMTETPTGLWYTIVEPGKGPAIQTGNVVRYAYTTRLITGKICYHADTTTPKKIVVGKGNIEAGLEEGFLMMKEGGHARFMIPPHLGHGNFGDGNCIPGASILLVDVEVLSVK